MTVLTVTEFVRGVDEALAAFDGVVVEGEVTEYRVLHGKWVTFQLKDDKSSVGCFLPLWNLKTKIEDGMMIRATGRPRLRDKGFFSFVIDSLTPTGEGALKRAFELLKKKLEKEGLFDDSRKRALPKFPQRIGFITSKDAAAYADFLKVLQARQGGLAISFVHTQVQGEPAVKQLLTALETINTLPGELDALVMVRGGGSMEDLMAFNDEAVVRAVAASRTPIIVGVGHERDVTLAELAADVRASTPSNAAELLVRSREEVTLEVQQMRQQLTYTVRDQLTKYTTTTKRLIDILRGQVATMKQGLTHLEQVMTEMMRNKLVRLGDNLVQLERVLKSLSPEHVLKRGYSITRLSGGQVIKSASDVSGGDIIETQLANGAISSKVTK